MRIDVLELLAFGPFSGTRLDFSAGDAGLHLVFGNNEAGKSSALRALGDLLYGIPHRTVDAFQHPHTKLRLGARLRKADQSVLEFVRRKGRTPLRCAQDTKKIDESQLEPFRPVADRELFETMFALNHERLVQGGRHILEGGGRLGELLFEAGTGLGNLQQIQNRLKEQIEALYLPKGRNPTINKTLSAWREARAETKRTLLIADDWTRLSRQLEEKRSRLRQLDRQIQIDEGHNRRLVRLQEAIPCAVRRRQLQQELETLQDVVPVQAEQVREISERLTKREALDVQLNGLREEQATLQGKIAAIHVDVGALSEAASLNDYREWLGSYRKALNDRPELEMTRRLTEQRIADALHSLGYDVTHGAEQPAIANHVAVRIQELAGQYDALRERLNHRRRQGVKLQQELEQVRAQRDSVAIVKDVAALEHRAGQLPDPRGLLEQLSKLNARADQIGARCSDRIARLPGWRGSVEQLVRLEVPTRETVKRHEENLQSALREKQVCEERVAESRFSSSQLSDQLQSLEKGQTIPTEEELQRLRATRDERWDNLREMLETLTAETDLQRIRQSGLNSLLALRADWEAADAMSDRLRREADRVAEKARIIAQQDRIQQQLDERQVSLQKAVEQLQVAEFAWAELWKNIVDEPLSPPEMFVWLELHREICELHDDALAVALERQQLDAQLATLSDEVDTLLGLCQGVNNMLEESRQNAPEESQLDQRASDSRLSLVNRIGQLEGFIKQALLSIQAREQLSQRCRDLESELREAEANAREAEADWEQWQIDWREEMQKLRLPQDALPAQARAVLASLAKIATEVAAVKELDVRIAGIDREANEFEQQLKRLADRVGDTIGSIPEAVESLAASLFEFLEQNVQANQQRDLLVAQLESIDRELQKRTMLALEIDAHLSASAKQLKVKDPERLLEIARQGERRSELEAKCDELDETLTSLCGGRTISQLWEEVHDAEPSLEENSQSSLANWENVDVDLLKSWSRAAAERVEKLRDERDDLIREIERDQADFEKMNGSGDAATLEQQVQELQIELADQVRELQVLRVMDVGLRTAMTRYRDQNELPILKRAAALFAQLTAGRYLDLRLDADEQGEPIVVAVRSTGDGVHVEQMSDGTRDQLYLAIRLASLDQWLENREPMLFVLDDVLLNFDDERAIACLKTFADYAAKTQLIMFTHHAHLVELARHNIEAGRLFVHELDSGYPAT